MKQMLQNKWTKLLFRSEKTSKFVWLEGGGGIGGPAATETLRFTVQD